MWLNPSLLHYGDLNLLGLLNPLASVAPKTLLYGEVAGWTSEQRSCGATRSTTRNGQTIIWGDTDTTDDYDDHVGRFGPSTPIRSDAH